MNNHAKILAAFVVASLASAGLQAKGTVSVYLTEKASERRLAPMGELELQALPQPTEKQQSVFVDAGKSFQTLLGIGGAFTDAAADTWAKLPEDKRREVIRAYFDPATGIGYSLGRTHINSCDFSSEMYTYVAVGDKELKTFDIAHDLKNRIPMLRAALRAAGRPFPIFVSPWSPPAWMKDNQSMLQGGKLKPEFAATWAQYFVKFIKAYESQGVPIWGLTVQNEPMAVQTWESCVYTAQEERDFIRDHLGPTLVREGLGEKKLIAWDHNRSLMYQRAEVIMQDPEAAKYVWGLGFHWYVTPTYDNVKLVHEAFPQLHLLFTEGCNGPYSSDMVHDWSLGEEYGRAMITDFNNGAEGWTDWNLLLDENGGPNHLGNFCFAPIHADTTRGSLIYTNEYYYIGHFSKFIRPGAKRIISSVTNDRLLSTAFLNTDGSIAVVVMNPSEKEQPFYLSVSGEAAETLSPAHSIMTLVVKR